MSSLKPRLASTSLNGYLTLSLSLPHSLLSRASSHCSFHGSSSPSLINTQTIKELIIQRESSFSPWHPNGSSQPCASSASAGTRHTGVQTDMKVLIRIKYCFRFKYSDTSRKEKRMVTSRGSSSGSLDLNLITLFLLAFTNDT